MPDSVPLENELEIGLNIIENITTGMYRDSRAIFREYIQNACDQIDRAVESGLLAPGEGQVEIHIDSANRSICIEDNATGIPAAQFRSILYSIGKSTKPLGEARGFRGIGHWCGVGYCAQLIFTAKAKGEPTESVMICDAETIRRLVNEYNAHHAECSVNAALAAATSFRENRVGKKQIDAHYFRVELLGIRDVHADLCCLQRVKDYLSFVAPVGYAPEFRFRAAIHQHALEIGRPIPEYNILIEGEHLRKKYTPSFTTSKGEDRISDVKFKDFRGANGELIAWLWFGISRFEGVLKKENAMRGLRLRMRNIQIGDEDALQKLFREDRGQHYFVGEVFALDQALIPNSQRDYFNDNEARQQFENRLSDFFNSELSRIYKTGSQINSKYSKIEKAQAVEAELSEAEASGGDVGEDLRGKWERAKKEAEKAAQELRKIRENTAAKLKDEGSGTVETVVHEILKANEEKHAARPPAAAAPPAAGKRGKAGRIPKAGRAEKTAAPEEKLVPWRKIQEIVRALADPATAGAILAKIEEELF